MELKDVVKEVVQEAIAPLEQKLAGIDQSLAGIQQSFAGIQQSFAGIQQSFAGIQQSFAGIQQAIKDIEWKLDTALEKLEDEDIGLLATYKLIAIHANGQRGTGHALGYCPVPGIDGTFPVEPLKSTAEVRALSLHEAKHVYSIYYGPRTPPNQPHDEILRALGVHVGKPEKT
ncbi:hypothetical protein MKEN_00605900 [Mycena kentingensis (nom. inval.)]|nr:hypothetical protein MKEN_00605900 [Mycena kentingensis (nom. inval.)]